MKGKSGGLQSKIGCKMTYDHQGDCLAGDKMIIFCRKGGKWRTSKIRSGADQLWECSAKKNVLAKLEVG